MFNGRIYFLGALYHVRGNFAHLPKFVGRFAHELNTLPYEQAAVLEKVHWLRERYNRRSDLIGQEEALDLMLAEDLGQVERVLRNENITAQIDSREEIEHVLSKCRDRIVDLLWSHKIQIDSPKIYIVDTLPTPYAAQGYSAFVADDWDRTQFGILPGVYFLRSQLRPFYSEFLLTHEFIHVVLGKINPDLLARGLEEGLAEMIGAMYLSSQMLGKELTTNLFIYNRLSYSYQQFWELYVDATRQATMLLHRYGLEGVMALLNRGREFLKKIEGYCFRMEFDKIDLPRGGFDPELTDIVDFLSLSFSRNLVVSPLARYLSRYVSLHASVGDILTCARVERIAGIKALNELSERLHLISLTENEKNFDRARVIRTDYDLLCESSMLRYEIQELK